MSLPPGFVRTLDGRYELDRQIGEGGMATVYLAHDRKHQRQVAIKVIKPQLGRDVGAERFLEEIRVTANLHHPHLVPLFDSGEAEGLLYYVMPYVAGESLRARLRREGPLPVHEAVRIARIVADAVDSAHRHGVVHRDLKPENILLVDGQPLVADFGVALAMSEVAATRMTGTGMSVGTPQYMSPEQVSAERDIDARSDVYALGAILYEMLAGQPPYAAPTAAAVLAKILTEAPPPLRSLRDAVPAALDAIVARAMARVPADRYETAAAFARALHDVDAREAPKSQVALVPDPATTMRSGWIGPAIALVCIAAVIALTMIAWRGGLPGGVREGPPSPSSSPRSLAVLPFENRSPDRNDEYFSDGLTEELLHRLARLPRFRVAARTSSFAFKGKPVDVSEVAQQLEVEAIVSGSVRRDGDLLRVTVQVIDVSDGRPIWSEVFERQSRDAFRVQDEIAEAIVQRLDPEGAAPVRQAGPSPEAFDLYLQGRHQWNRRTAEGAAAAIQLLTKAIALAPDYARAHAALAEAYAVMGFYDYMPPRTAFTKAREAATRAASLDPALPEVPNTLAYVALYHDWNLDLARREFARAINLSPRYAVAHQWYANALTVAGQFKEAAAAMRQAQELDPLAPTPHAALGWVHLYARDYAAAEAQLRRTLESHTQYPLAQLWLTEALEGQQRLSEALASADTALRIVPDDVVAQLLRARVLARLNRHAEAREVLAAVGRREAAGYVPAYPRALVLIALQDRDGAFALLDRALADRAHSIAFLRVDPALDPIRSDPRFDELVARASNP